MHGEINLHYGSKQRQNRHYIIQPGLLERAKIDVMSICVLTN